jgi:peptidoglycan/xylan/chitin deacetylase (PgdA/CDA1 family)
MRSALQCLLAAAALAAAVAAPVRAAERWIDAEPTAERVKSQWKEGKVETASEMGKSFVRITTDGKTNPTFAAMSGIAPAVDASKQFVKVLLRVHGFENLAGIELRVGSDAMKSAWYSYTVPLYGDPLYNLLQDGEWTTITMTLGANNANGAPNRGAIDSFGVAVSDKGKGPVQLDFGGVAVVDEPAEGVVSFTFDDGYKEHLTAMKLLAEHGWRGTAYVIPTTIGGPIYLTVDDLKEIQRLGSDVAAHDDPPFTDLPPNELEPRLRGIQDFLVQNGFALGAQHLAYPLGKQETRRVRPTVDKLFATARLAGSGPETLPPADPHLLRAFNVTDSTTPEQVAAAAQRAKDNHEWLILMFHWLPEKTAKPTDYSMSDFKRLLDAVAKTGVRVAPVSEVWAQIASPPQLELAKHATAQTSPASPAP